MNDVTTTAVELGLNVSPPLAIAWALLLAAAIFIYVVLDGFDLGLGILYPFFPERSERDLLMNSVAPVWDGNETWLVLGGGGLFAAFPLAYAIIMPALYPPVIAMLLALVFRGVAFEFRWRTERWRTLWDFAFIGGSTMAAFAQGVILGALLQGISVEGRAYSGAWLEWLSPFSVVCASAGAQDSASAKANSPVARGKPRCLTDRRSISRSRRPAHRRPGRRAGSCRPRSTQACR